MFFLVKIFLLLQLISLALARYSYDLRDSIGPSKWHVSYPECGGSKQSPINILTVNVESEDFPPLKTNFEDSHLGAVEISNNGHTVLMRPIEKALTKPCIQGGPFQGDSYVLEQMHFHWGPNDRFGSEHRINYRRSSMEMHSVFYNTKYNSFSVAATSNDTKALVVIGALVDASYRHQRKFWNFVTKLSQIERAGSNTTYNFGNLPFNEIISPSGGYYTYDGSLTTPPCSEIVTWIVLKERMKIASELLMQFRRMLNDENEFIFRNYRPTMQLNGRMVYSKLENAFADTRQYLQN